MLNGDTVESYILNATANNYWIVLGPCDALLLFPPFNDPHWKFIYFRARIFWLKYLLTCCRIRIDCFFFVKIGLSRPEKETRRRKWKCMLFVGFDLIRIMMKSKKYVHQRYFSLRGMAVNILEHPHLIRDVMKTNQLHDDK